MILTLNLLAIAVLSAGSMIVEIVAGRIIAPYVGMSLYSWTAVIAVVLTGLSVGHLIGGWLSIGSLRRSMLSLSVVGLAAAATTLLILVAMPAVASWALAPSREPLTAILLFSLALFFPPSLFIGVPSPILTKLAMDHGGVRSGIVLGTAFSAGAFGAIAGTMLAGYVFISWIGSSGTLIAVAVVYAAFGAVSLAMAMRAKRGLTVLAIVIVAGLLAPQFKFVAAEGLSRVCDQESDYYCIRAVDVSDDHGRPAKLMILDHLGHGINFEAPDDGFAASYIALMDQLASRRFERDMSSFFIGGGAYTLPRAWANRGNSVSVSEIDPAVTIAAEENFWFASSPVSIHHQDARKLLRDASYSGRFDVVVGDAFRDIAVPPHLVTLEFAKLVRSRLQPDGIYLVNLVDHADRRLALFAMVKTLAQAFSNVEVWVDRSEARAGGRMTFVLYASERASGLDDLAEPDPDGRAFARWPTHDLARRIAGARVPVLTDDYAPIDRLIGVTY